MLLTLVAIPCITPFMAPAIGFALTQSSILISLSIFLFLDLEGVFKLSRKKLRSVL
jgi:thiol:disulfide interchange protein